MKYKSFSLFQFFERLVNPFPEKKPLTLSQKIIPFIWQCCDGVKRYLVLMFIFSAIVGSLDGLAFAALGYLVDHLTLTNAADLNGLTITQYLAIFISCLFILILGTFVKYQVVMGYFPMRLRWNFHRIILNQSLDFFQNEYAGRISTKVMQTALAVRDVCTRFAEIVVFVIIYLVTMLSIISTTHFYLLLPFLLWLLFYLLMLYRFVPLLANAALVQSEARALMTGKFTDSYSNIMTVQLFAHNETEEQYAKQAMQDFLQTVQNQMRLITKFDIRNYILCILLLACIVSFSLLLWRNEQISIGAVTIVITIALRLKSLSRWIMSELTLLVEGISVVRNGLETLSQPSKITDISDASEIDIKYGEIVFENVSFQYHDNLILNNINLKIQPGEHIAIVGRSGSGKSTLINLLLRFYDVSSGRILIDGQDISQISQKSLRAQMSVVSQDTALLHRSIKENILYSKPNSTEQELLNAIRQTQLEDLINSNDIQVGERGSNLSGGQRQRISIARAMLKNAPILLLDEATSALDPETEKNIHQSLAKLIQGKTAITITHHLANAVAMDRIIVIDKGEIVENGSHAELMRSGGIYTQLWNQQQQ